MKIVVRLLKSPINVLIHSLNYIGIIFSSAIIYTVSSLHTPPAPQLTWITTVIFNPGDLWQVSKPTELTTLWTLRKPGTKPFQLSDCQQRHHDLQFCALITLYTLRAITTSNSDATSAKVNNIVMQLITYLIKWSISSLFNFMIVKSGRRNTITATAVAVVLNCPKKGGTWRRHGLKKIWRRGERWRLLYADTEPTGQGSFAGEGRPASEKADCVPSFR